MISVALVISEFSTWPMTHSSTFIFLSPPQQKCPLFFLVSYVIQIFRYPWSPSRKNLFDTPYLEQQEQEDQLFLQDCPSLGWFLLFTQSHMRFFQTIWGFCNGIFSKELQPFNKAFVTLWNELILFLYSKWRMRHQW